MSRPAPKQANREHNAMMRFLVGCAAGGILLTLFAGNPVLAQKHGGILKLYVLDSPPSVSILDGPNPVGQRTIAPVFNNLIMFDPL